jgi:hypothetical protein
MLELLGVVDHRLMPILALVGMVAPPLAVMVATTPVLTQVSLAAAHLLKATPVALTVTIKAAGSKPTTKQQVQFAYLAATKALRKNKTLLVGFAYSLKL